MVAGIAVAALLVGILIGRRCKVTDAIRDLLDAAKAAAAAAAANDDGAGAEDDNEGEDNDDLQTELEELLQNFMSTDWVGGLDDHPEMEINPILSYHVKKRKDEMRARQELEAQLIARGLEPDHLDKMSEEERKAFLQDLKGDAPVVLKSNVGSVPGLVRKYGATVNSSAILVKVGARFTSGSKAQKGAAVADAGALEKKAAQEVREKLKLIDGLLASREVDVSRSDGKKNKSARAGGLVKNALEVAKDTKYKPYGGEAFKRSEELHTYAARGRARVSAPLDHAISAASERNARRQSCGAGGAGRRASTSGGGKQASIVGAASRAAAGPPSEDNATVVSQMRRASALLAGGSLDASLDA